MTESSADHEETALVSCATSKGPIVMEFHRGWSPNGYDRAVGLFEQGFYDHSHFFRVVKGFLVQFGITYNKNLKNQPHIPDDPQKDPPIPFDTGIISFAGSGPNSRTSQLFIAYGPNRGLGRELWETPLGRVIEGMDHVEAFYSYGDMPPWGEGPVQGRIHNGPQYIENNFPLTDKFDTCQVERLGKDIKAEDYAKAEHERQGLAKELPSKLRASRESDTSDEGIFGLIPMPLAQAIGFILLILAVIKLLLPSRKVLNKSS